MMNKLYYFLFVGILSVLFSCKDENKFVLEENTVEIEQIITAVIEQDSINILKNNKDSVAVLENFRKIKLVKTPPFQDENAPPLYFLGKDEMALETLYSLEELEKNGKIISFDEKDSLYLLSQNEISDTIILPECILENANILKENELKNWNWKKQYDSYYRFNFPIISKDKTKAYLEVGYICGGLCGRGTAYFLQKQNGKWMVVSKWATWIS